MTAESINSISEFLLHAGTNFRILDLGRGVVPVSGQEFLDMENGLIAPPRPRQQHGWYAILFWNGQASEQHYIWFIKLPLDEQGKIVSAARNHFLQIIVDALGNRISKNDSASSKLPDNPYSFVPNQTLMAQFGAVARKLLNHPPCAGYLDVESYVRDPETHDWNALSLQAIADFAARINRAQGDWVVKHFDSYSTSFQLALLNALESSSLPEPISMLLQRKLLSEDKEPLDDAMELASLRALSAYTDAHELTHFLQQYITKKEDLSLDHLSVLAARHYRHFDTKLTRLYFEEVAKSDEKLGYNGELFTGLFSDLVQIPELRAEVLALLRSPERSPLLANAFGRVFSKAQNDRKSQ
ncbi:DUF3549 family protein [Alteromonas aestuariivivens]|uniref:DUF3549 family protein n=1 Tax=Alteromonas aestuariivivens TaxID=1938339 RepID=A0A3D8M5G4_9ALTE|nr:DUF3549 family protein [Alteromonas aestuariivivens]RDV24392.1 DUF3549 family protein [Alteromonas aestuariivivens]